VAKGSLNGKSRGKSEGKFVMNSALMGLTQKYRIGRSKVGGCGRITSPFNCEEKRGRPLATRRKPNTHRRIRNKQTAKEEKRIRGLNVSSSV